MQEKVLVIDDDLASGKTMMWAMEAMGHEVYLFQDGPSALYKTQTVIPDIVLCDIKMPGMSGYEVCQKMRADPRLHKTLFIAQTGLISPLAKQKALECGFAHYLVKPIDVNALLELVYLERAKASDIKLKSNA